MRIETINEINTNKQRKSFSAHNQGASTRSTSGLKFEDCLKAHIEKTAAPAITPLGENQVAGLLLSYFTQMKLTQKSEPRFEPADTTAS